MRIYIVNLVGQGGMAHYNHQLASAIAERGGDVTMLTTTDYELADLPGGFDLRPTLDLWPRIDEERRVESRRLRRMASRARIKARRLRRAVRLYATWIRVTQQVVRARPDIVQFGSDLSLRGASAFLRLMRRSGARTSWICHEFQYRERRNSAEFPHTRRLLRNLDVVFAHGKMNRDALLELGNLSDDRVIAIDHGNEDLFVELAGDSDLNQDYQQAIGPSDSVILFFGTMRPSKGVTDLLEAFALLPDRDGVKLVIAGYPTRLTDPMELIERCDQLGISDHVVFDFRYVPIEEVAALMRRSLMVVLPYRNATQSGVLQVAYAFGVPVVATSVGAIPEVVEQGETGLLVPPEDPRELSAAIARLLARPEDAARMGASARHLASTRFSWETVAETVLEAYRNILAPSDL